jgi:predicted DCC family thiol-disulfide oxidoreductase YuxK
VADDTVRVLYDRDCGFCRWSLSKLLAWDRDRKLRPVSIQSEEGQRLLADVPEDERMRSWHLVHPDGRVESAAAGFPELFSRLPVGTPVARATRALPGLSQRGYRLLVDKRRLLGRPLTQGMKDRATERIDRHAPR